MPSPFPGMDPYIESSEIWSDFHHNLATEIQARLNGVIQPRYFAGVGSYATYEVIEIGESRGIRPDVGIWQRQPPQGAVSGGVATITPAPAESAIPFEVPLRLYHVEIRE